MGKAGQIQKGNVRVWGLGVRNGNGEGGKERGQGWGKSQDTMWEKRTEKGGLRDTVGYLGEPIRLSISIC